MKYFYLFLLFSLMFFKVKAERYDGKTFTLYQGGPSITFTSDGAQWTGDKNCGGASNEICRTSVYFHEFASDNSNIFMQTATYQANCNSGDNRKWNYWNQCIATTSYVYSTVVEERRTFKSTWWQRDCLGCKWYNRECSGSNDRIGSFRVEVVEPVRFVNINGIRNLCKASSTVNLRNYLNDLTRGTIYLDNAPLGNGDILDLTKIPAGDHQIYVKQSYANGDWESKHEFITIIDAPSIKTDSSFSLCQDYGIYYLNGTPTGGTWKGTGISGNTFNTKGLSPKAYDLTYSKTDQYGCSASKTITVTVIKTPDVSNNIQTEFCNKDQDFDLTLDTPENGVWKGKGITGMIFSPGMAGVGSWSISLEVVSKGCKNSVTKVVKVKPNPEIYIGTPVIVCENSLPVEITGDSPLGGKYIGTGAKEGTGGKYTFDPTGLKPSNYNLTYSYTNEQGCSSTKIKTAIVNPKPILEVAAKDITLCPEQSQYYLNNVLPAGGVYSGNFVTGTIFNVKNAGSGTNTVTYKYIDGNNCSNTTNFTVSVTDKAVIDAGPDFEACVNDESVKISGHYPEGGVWKGAGVAGEYFYPPTAGVGTYTLRYEVKYGQDCQGFDTRVVKVKERPQVYAGNALSVCTNGAPVKLITGVPTGGFWSGEGVEGDMFDPSGLTAGSMQVKYTYKNPENGCSNTATRYISVNNAPFVSAPANFFTCINSSARVLSGLPDEAIWRGNGINGNIFNPAVAGPGIHTLMLTLKDGSGCIGKDSTLAIVNAVPEVNAGDDVTICKNSKELNLLGTPSGGTWIGDGIEGNTFVPSDVSNAKITVKYSFTDQNQCTGADSKVITILPVPSVTIQRENKICENSPVLKLQGGYPSGGKWDGNGVIDNNFYPARSEAGPQLVTYTFTDGNNCSNSASSYVNVIEAPVINAGKDTVLCRTSDYFDVLTFKAQPSGGQWTGEILKNNIINPATLNAGRYTVVYTYTDNITSCVNQASVAVEIQNGLDIPAISGDTILCIGDTVNLEAASLNEDIDTKYHWYKQGENKPFAEGKRIDFLNNKSITLFAEAITPMKKCPSVKGKVDLTNDTPEGNITATKSTLEKEDYVKFAFTGTGVSYHWEFGDDQYSTEKSPAHYYYQLGLFTVKAEVTSPNGCKAQFKKTDFIKVTGDALVIVTEADDNSIYPQLDLSSINGYPNPVSDLFNLEFSGVPSCDISITDLTGKVIYNGKIDGNKGFVDFRNYPDGYYILIVKSDKVFKSIKVEKF